MQLGDFNTVRKHLEGFDNIVAADFNSCLDFINMDDMPTKGFWYTWSNQTGGGATRVGLTELWLIWMDG